MIISMLSIISNLNRIEITPTLLLTCPVYLRARPQKWSFDMTLLSFDVTFASFDVTRRIVFWRDSNCVFSGATQMTFRDDRKCSATRGKKGGGT